jgi:thymidylate kinase
MKIDLVPHGQPGALVAICGFDGSGKSTLEAALLAAITPTRPCVSAWAPTEWWRQDANVRRTLFREGTGQALPEEALLHFNLADCYAHQANMILPALARGEVVIGNRYLFDMLALFEARGLTQPVWLLDAVARIVRPDFCFVLDGSAELLVDRIVRRDGSMPGRFDQNVPFIERYNAALRRMAEANHLTVLRAEADPGEILQQCLDVLRGAGWR